MKGTRVAIRYAKALLATAQEQKAVDQVAEDVEAIFTTVQNSHELKAVLSSPVISAELKGEHIAIGIWESVTCCQNVFGIGCRKQSCQPFGWNSA